MEAQKAGVLTMNNLNWIEVIGRLQHTEVVHLVDRLLGCESVEVAHSTLGEFGLDYLDKTIWLI